MTITIVEDDGIEDYQPTVVLLDRREIRVIDDIPDHVAHTDALKAALREEGSTNYLFAVKVRRNELVAGACEAGSLRFRSIRWDGVGYVSRRADKPDWWRADA